jgi:hypothetical protein
VFSGSVSYQQGSPVDIGGGAISCMDQASVLAVGSCIFADNTCVGCSGGAVFSSCDTFLGASIFFNNSVISNNSAVSGHAVRHAQIGNNLYFFNSSVWESGAWPAAAATAAVSLSATAGKTNAIIGNVTFGNSSGGAVYFSTSNVGAPTFTLQVADSTFLNSTTTASAGGAVNTQVFTGTGAMGFGNNVFESNIAIVGGAISIVDVNATNDVTVYMQGNTFACNGALYGSGHAVNNGDTKGNDAAKTLLSIQNNFVFIKGCPPQTVLGPCQGDPGQCPTS